MSEALEAPAPTGDSAGLAAWIDFADNGHIRFWTADPALSESEKQAGRHLRGFTLAELVMFAALRQPPQPTGDVESTGTAAVLRGCARAGMGASRETLFQAAFELDTLNSRLAEATEAVATQNGVIVKTIEKQIAAEQALRTAREALIKIAAFSDTGASELFLKTGSYSGFDEPGSVQIARAALTGAGEEGE